METRVRLPHSPGAHVELLPRSVLWITLNVQRNVNFMIVKESVVKRIDQFINIDTDDCINYPILNRNGYGEMQSTLDGKKMHYLMHRAAYQVYYKDDLTPSDIICHTCDNPACVNPKHLFKGTHNDNVQDKVNKGRQAKGETNGRYIDGRSTIKKNRTYNHVRKLTKEQVLEIRELRKGNTLSIVSKLTGVSISSVKDICSGRTYSCY